jgi:hypothetical protein
LCSLNNASVVIGTLLKKFVRRCRRILSTLCELFYKMWTFCTFLRQFWQLSKLPTISHSVATTVLSDKYALYSSSQRVYGWPFRDFLTRVSSFTNKEATFSQYLGRMLYLKYKSKKQLISFNYHESFFSSYALCNLTSCSPAQSHKTDTPFNIYYITWSKCHIPNGKYIKTIKNIVFGLSFSHSISIQFSHRHFNK